MRAILDLISKKLFLITVMLVMAVSVTASASISPVEIVTSAKPWVILAIFIWEYLVGKTKVVKSNSTIEMLESFIKKIFGISDSDLSLK